MTLIEQPPDDGRRNQIVGTGEHNISTIAASLQYVESVHVNVAQPIIVTTEDKVHRCLMAHVSTIENRKAWIAPLGLLVTVGAVLVTCNFRDFILPANVWHAMFALTALGSVVWLAKALFALRKSHSVEDVIKELKANSLHK